jgi:hypothetical protein
VTPDEPHGAAPTGLERLVGRPLTPLERRTLRDLVARLRFEQEEAVNRVRWGKGTGTKSNLYRRPAP